MLPQLRLSHYPLSQRNKRLMFSIKNCLRAVLAFAALSLLASCNAKRSDLPTLAPATTVVVTDYTALASLKPGAVKTWTITDSQRVARLVALADAKRQGWRDIGAANLTTREGIEMKFTGAGVNQIFAVYPRGFDNSYSTAPGNLWSREDRVGPITQSKLIPDAELDQLIADIRAVIKNVKPDATPTTAATSSPSKAASDKIKSKGQP